MVKTLDFYTNFFIVMLFIITDNSKIISVKFQYFNPYTYNVKF